VQIQLWRKLQKVVSMFNIGDVLSVSKKGICKVEDIAKNVFIGCDKSKLYYVLRPVSQINNMVVYFPTDSPVAMRKVASKQQAIQALQNIKPEQQLGDFADNERLVEFNKIIQEGSFDDRIKVLNSLGFRKKTIAKKLFNLNEQRQLSNLIDLVASEIAYSADENESEIKEEIIQKIQA